MHGAGVRQEPGLNLLSSSSITLLMNRSPHRHQTLLAACCQSETTAPVPKDLNWDTLDRRRQTSPILKVPRRKTGHSAFSSIEDPAANVLRTLLLL